MAESETLPQFRDDEENVSPEYLRAVIAALDEGNHDRVSQLTEPLHEADLADLIELLPSDDRVRLIELLGPEFDVWALPELDPGVRDELMEALPNELIARAVANLETDDAAYLIEDMDAADKAEILAHVPSDDRIALSRALDYPEYTAGRLMQTDFVAVPAWWTVGRTIDHMRTDKDLPEDFLEIYVVDPRFHLVGVVPVSRVLRNPRSNLIADIMNTEQTVFKVTDEQDDVAFKFEHYNLYSAAVVDGDGRLVGSLAIEDVVDVMQEEVEEDMLRLGGVGDEEITDTVWSTLRSRMPWLLVNLGTAVLASRVIALFDATIEEMVALAVMMPIVASMGGNAGTQTMTVAVRALATRDLGPINAFRVVWRECAVGLINGLVFAVLLGLIAWWLFSSNGLGLVIAAAMIINFCAAACAGILIPLTLSRVGADPAVASSVFVTTVTDVTGFFAFLGLAALWLV